MFVFVMALKSKQVSHSWGNLSRTFENTLRSVCRQTCPDFKIVVVCHERPELVQSFDDRVEWLSVDFPPPQGQEPQLYMLDKWKKLGVGMIRAGELRPTFVMIMDADDLVSKRLVEFALANPAANGWDFDTGYHYASGSRWILRQSRGFSAVCGTSAIVHARHIRFPVGVSPEDRENCIVLRWGHTTIARKMHEAGNRLERLPFPGAVYVESHGDNHTHLGTTRFQWPGWRKFTRTLPQWRPCTRRICEEFHIAPPNHAGA
jgi:hypothetical protein